MVAVVGGGGHGHDLALIATANEQRTVFYDDDPARGNPIEGSCLGYMVGINDPAARAFMVDRLTRLGWATKAWLNPSFQHPSAVVTDVCAAEGIAVGPLASVLSSDLRAHTHIGAGAHITRATIGSFVTIAPGATVCGDVTIGDRTMIGAGAVIKNLLHIGCDVTIGCGAVVVADVPDGTTVLGNPARPFLR